MNNRLTEQGVWVFRTGQPLSASTTDELFDQIRKERDRSNLGWCPRQVVERLRSPGQ